MPFELGGSVRAIAVVDAKRRDRMVPGASRGGRACRGRHDDFRHAVSGPWSFRREFVFANSMTRRGSIRRAHLRP